MAIVYKDGGSWKVIYKPKNEEAEMADLKSRNLVHYQVNKLPTLGKLHKWLDEGICPCPDGCRVEPDGSCVHGFDSWLLILGYI